MSTRRDFIVRGTVAIGALCGAGLSAAAADAAGSGDGEILRFLLSLEMLQHSLYTGKAATLHLGPRARELVHELAGQEATHVMTVAATLSAISSRPPPAIAAAFPAARDETSFLRLAASLENTAVGTYNGLLPMLANKVALAQTAAIVQVDARHAAALAQLQGGSPTPNGAFDAPISQGKAIAQIAAMSRA